MPRLTRIVLPGWVHHITQRGNHRQIVFFSDQDRLVYLKLLQKHFTHYQLDLIGFCLMDNHVHLVVVPHKENSLADGIGQLHRDFARWQNLQCNRTGHLWQNRFFSCPVEEECIWQVLSYVELNRVRAGLVSEARAWKWCSAPAHVTGIDRSGLLDMHFWEKYFNGGSWKKFLEDALAETPIQDQIRTATHSGRFLGNRKVAEQLERQLGKTLLQKKRGRKVVSPSTSS